MINRESARTVSKKSPLQEPTNSARISGRGHGTLADGIHESVPRYQFYLSGANRGRLRGECGAGAERCQFVSRQAAKRIKLSESDKKKIYTFLIKSAVIGVSRDGRASAEPVRYRAAKLSQTEHFSAAQWVGDGAGRLRLR